MCSIAWSRAGPTDEINFKSVAILYCICRASVEVPRSRPTLTEQEHEAADDIAIAVVNAVAATVANSTVQREIRGQRLPLPVRLWPLVHHAVDDATAHESRMRRQPETRLQQIGRKCRQSATAHRQPASSYLLTIPIRVRCSRPRIN